MTAATAKLRRRQFSLGAAGLAVVFGSKQAAPKYPPKMTREVSERRESAARERAKKVAARGRKKG